MRDDQHRFLTLLGQLPARLTAPASGLFLDRVSYSAEADDTSVRAVTPVALR